ncbi:MAG: hypothetical protein M3307_00290, partial [Thermoproteota archaeon]|nr:hypothetical protein [Thermoproteota archaeon]
MRSSAMDMRMMIIIIVLTAIATALVVVVLLFGPNAGMASAQQQQLTSIPAVIENGTFQNTADGFR